jgi:CxxC-x17-CxxC domain-containing protein
MLLFNHNQLALGTCTLAKSAELWYPPLLMFKKPFRKDRPSGGRGYKGGNSGGYGDRPNRPMTLHDAVCAQCSSVCQVPFRPTGSRPVYCQNCFKRDDAGGERGGYGEKRSYNDRPSKPMFHQPEGGGMSTAKIEERLKSIEAKLDAFLDALTSDVDEDGADEDATDET